MTTTVLMTAMALLLGAITALPAYAAEKLCSGTSKAGRSACKSEVKDDFLNLPTKEARKACKAEAKVAAAEAKEECGDVFDAREAICDLLGQDPY